MFYTPSEVKKLTRGHVVARHLFLHTPFVVHETHMAQRKPLTLPDTSLHTFYQMDSFVRMSVQAPSRSFWPFVKLYTFWRPRPATPQNYSCCLHAAKWQHYCPSALLHAWADMLTDFWPITQNFALLWDIWTKRGRQSHYQNKIVWLATTSVKADFFWLRMEYNTALKGENGDGRGRLAGKTLTEEKWLAQRKSQMKAQVTELNMRSTKQTKT